MAPSPCLEVWRAKGQRSGYGQDCLVRTLLGKRYDDALRLLGLELDEPATLTIASGIGRLTIEPSGQTWAPTIAHGDAPLGRLVPPTQEQVEHRRTTCQACSRYRPASDTCGTCGCGAVIAQRSASPLGSCPEGRWPATQAIPAGDLLP